MTPTQVTPTRVTPTRAWQRMRSGRRLNLLDPSPLDIELDDIAHGLARVARWNGQTQGEQAFSVAQHSLLVLEIFEARHPKASGPARLTCLLHDAAEYVIGDMIAPFKAVLGGYYRETEARLDAAIQTRFGLTSPTETTLKQRIKRADRIAAHVEAVQLAGFSPSEARRLFGNLPERLAVPQLAPLTAGQAKAAFIAAFTALSPQTRQYN